jgi:hypothetical protein
MSSRRVATKNLEEMIADGPSRVGMNIRYVRGQVRKRNVLISRKKNLFKVAVEAKIEEGLGPCAVCLEDIDEFVHDS